MQEKRKNLLFKSPAPDLLLTTKAVSIKTQKQKKEENPSLKTHPKFPKEGQETRIGFGNTK
jgi:hypothetical protein